MESRFKQYRDEIGCFHKIPIDERLHKSPTLCGWMKLASLLHNPEEFVLLSDDTGNDGIYFEDDKVRYDLTDDDIIYLLRCGIDYYDRLQLFNSFPGSI